MNTAVKWIGGATAFVLLFFASATITGYAIQGDSAAADATAPAASEAVSLQPDAAIDGELAQLAAAQDSAAQGANLAPAQEPDAAASAAPEATAPESAATLAPFTIKRVLPISGPIKYGEWHWDTEGVPDGPLLITVDLDARVISVFQGGYEIGAAAALLGTQKHPTPLGTFPILTKERHNVSEKYGNAPMPWTLRLTWDGIAIHGGSQVENGYASHGCIGVPDEFASRLFDLARKGDKVIITRGQRIGVGDAIIS